MKRVVGILLCVSVFVLFNGCNYKERKFKKEFVGKTWIIDKALEMMNNPFAEDSVDREKLVINTESWSYILKPEKDSTLGIYRDQDIRVEYFKIKDDTLFLKLEKRSYTEGKEAPYHYVPYKFVKTGKYSATLFAYDTNSRYFEIYLTDLTDLFNGKPDNSKSKLYQQIKGFTWYPIKIEYAWFYDKEDYEDQSPKYYVKERAFYINEVGNVNFLYGDTNCIYKFVDGDTNHVSRFYIYDTLNKELSLASYYVPEIDNKLHILRRGMMNWLQENILMKKIDHSMLVNEKKLPKGVRFDCNVEKARLVLLYNLPMNDDAHFYFDLESINLIRDNFENCEYVFTVIRRNRTYSDIYTTIRLLVTTTDGRYYDMKQIK